MTESLRVLVGTYTEPIVQGTGAVIPGRGEGVYALEVDARSGRFGQCCPLAATPNPSYLALSRDGRRLYAVNELKEYDKAPQGSLTVFALDGGRAQVLGVGPTHGTDPCHVVLRPDDRLAVVSNYSGGSVCAYRLDADGLLAGETQVLEGVGGGPNPTRQAGPHVHCGLFSPDGRYLYATDLGRDEIGIYACDPVTGHLTPVGGRTLSPGSGPRHLAANPVGPWLYVITELTNTIGVYAADLDHGELTPHSQVGTRPADAAGPSTAGAIRVSPNGRFVFGTNRGDDSVAVFSVRPDGCLEAVGFFPSGGSTPRDATLEPSGRYLFVANQDSDQVVSFAIGSGGELEPVDAVAVPTPVCVVTAPCP